MTLATATKTAVPSARMVLLRGFDDRGFGFFTNYESQKGRELRDNPKAALVVYWGKLGRQVRISGSVVRQSTRESETYFHNRPVASQISAAISPQSEVVESRAVLEERAAALAERYKDAAVPLPDNWGGYRLTPDEIEFWLHRENRLHDRLRYRRRPDGRWKIERLAP